MEDLLDLRGKVALVTGAGQGVGREVALRFAAHNAGTVVVNDFFLDRAEAVAHEIEAMGAKALALQSDVTDYASVARMFAEVEAAAGPVEILVNNAGNAGPLQDPADVKPFWETDPADWDSWLSTNLFGVLNCSRAAVPGMIGTGGGRVITVISDAGRVGEPHLAVYSAAKAGASGFMRALARAVGRFGITANSVALAGINTPGVQKMIADPETLKRILKSYVIRRLGEPSDPANMILFLASDAASWITGQTYPVNGGYSISA